MKFFLSLLLGLSLLLAGCASPSSSGGRTLRFSPPPVRYETFEPVFSEVPPQKDSVPWNTKLTE